MAVTEASMRQDVFSALNTLLAANKPTYTDPDGNTQTYTIVAEFQEDNPTFPQIAINKAMVSLTLQNMDGTGRDYGVEVQLDFYTKGKHGKKAIDAGMDSVQNTILDNQSSLRTTDGLLLMEEPFDESNNDTFETNNQVINTASLILRFSVQ
jgi:hypothetical protein